MCAYGSEFNSLNFHDKYLKFSRQGCLGWGLGGGLVSNAAVNKLTLLSNIPINEKDLDGNIIELEYFPASGLGRWRSFLIHRTPNIKIAQYYKSKR